MMPHVLWQDCWCWDREEQDEDVKANLLLEHVRARFPGKRFRLVPGKMLVMSEEVTWI
jgi:hypothetical protein